MNTTETIEQGRLIADPVRAHQPLTVINGGRDVSIFEKVAVQLMSKPDANMDQLQQIMQMHERWEERQAEKAFVAAMAQFKKNPPKIVKDKFNGYENGKGQTVGYMSATLAAVCDAAIAGLAEVEISHRWEVEQSGNQVTVICVLTHAAGHSTRTPITAPADTSGKKNAIQSIASSITYLERYTLLAATGLAAEDQDDDGAGHSDKFLPWAYDVQAQLEAAEDFANLTAVRNAAAKRCQKEGAQREWNELINPTFKRVGEKAGWIPKAEIPSA